MTPKEIREALEDALSILEGPDPDELWPDWRSRSIEFRRTWLRKFEAERRAKAKDSPPVASAGERKIATSGEVAIPTRNAPGQLSDVSMERCALTCEPWPRCACGHLVGKPRPARKGTAVALDHKPPRCCEEMLPGHPDRGLCQRAHGHNGGHCAYDIDDMPGMRDAP